MTPARLRRLLLAGLAGLAAGGSGCRLFNRDKGSSGDPLFGSTRIPKTDLPVPGRNASGPGRGDPLFTSPATAPKEEKAAADLPREPFRNSAETTAAGLAAGRADEPLSIGERPDRRAGGGSTSRPVPLAPRAGTPGGATYEQLANELRRAGAKWDEPLKENSEYVLRATVPVGSDGAVRRYEGSGDTPAAAAKQVIDQLRDDGR